MSSPGLKTLIKLSPALVMGLITISVTHPLWDLGFYAGDTTNIEIVSNYSLFELIFTPSGVQAMNTKYYTPFHGSTLRLDWILFGLSPLGYTFHNILWVWGLGISVFIFFRGIGINQLKATICGVWVILSPITLSTAAMFSTRHYLFCAAFCFLSLYAISLWQITHKKLFLGVAILFFLFGLQSKEIAVILIMVAPFIVTGPENRKYIIKVVAWVIMIYILLRIAMLGGLKGINIKSDSSFVEVMNYFGKSWLRMTESLIYGGEKLKPNIYAILAGNIILFFILYKSWLMKGIRGVLFFSAIIIFAFLIAAPTYMHPDYYFWSRMDSSKFDRIAFLFSTVVHTSLCYLTFFNPLQQRDQEIGEKKLNRQVRSEFFLILLLPLIIWAGQENLMHWRTKKFHNWQWEFVRLNIDKDIYFTGEEPPSLENFIRLSSDNKERGAKVIGWNQNIKDFNEFDYSKVYLILPGKQIRTASSKAEMEKWIEKYNNRKPSHGSLLHP